VSAARRILRVLRARLRTLRGRIAHHRELRAGATLDARPDRTPIFVLGAPRSGTTLLYQLLVEGLDVGWLANAHAAVPGDVSRIERDRRPRAARTSSDWQSRHGATSEPWGPSELGEFWYRFVPRRPHQLHAGDATPARTSAIRAAVRLFAAACERPVVFKNVFNSLRVPVLAAALPEARFILIERDLESNARSLLAGRLQRGDLDAWWSAEPDGAAAVRADGPAAQVAWQVRRMNEVAHAELGRLDAGRSIVIGYGELCEDPVGVLDRIHAWLVEGGSDVRRRSDASLPQRFDRRRGGSLPRELEDDLRHAVASASIGDDRT